MNPPGVALITSTTFYNEARWGDYSAVSTDPLDGSAWFVNEYIKANTTWATRIGTAAFPTGTWPLPPPEYTRLATRAVERSESFFRYNCPHGRNMNTLKRNLCLGADSYFLTLAGCAIVLAPLQLAVPLAAQNPGKETPVPATGKLTAPPPKVRTLEEMLRDAEARGSAGDTNDGGNVFGQMVRACTCPAKSTDRPCSAEPLAGGKIRASTLAGQEVVLVTTGAGGKYRVRVAPGTYHIEAELPSPGKTKDLPADVTIQKGEWKQLNICIEMEKAKAEPRSHTGVLHGIVTLGPVSPISTLDTQDTAPVRGVQIVISTIEGAEIDSVITDDHGRYRMTLPPDTYRVEMPRLPRIGMLTKYPPATVTIVAGQESCLDIHLDTGIR